MQAGIAAEAQLVTLRNALHVHIAGEFAIESEGPEVGVTIDRRSIRRAGAFEDEVRASFYREAIGLNLLDLCEIEIVTGEVEMKAAGRRIIVGGSAES